MSSVLILSGAKGDTRRYRTFHPCEQLRLIGVECQLSHITYPKLPVLVQQADLVIFHRVPYDRYVEQLLALCRARNKLSVLDIDDLLFEPSAFGWIDSPDFQDPVRASLYKEDMRRHRTMLEKCVAIIASTNYLGGQARHLDKPAWIHRNAFSLEMLAIAQEASRSRQLHPDKVVIGYASGTPTHDKDFAVVKPAIQRILQKFPHTELWLVGPLNLGNDWGDLQARIRQYPLVPWRKLPAVLAQFDINLAPLVSDNPFAQSKSEIKYMEAALVAVPTVASPTEAFQIAIRDGHNGFLASQPQAWVECLTQLVESPELRQELGQNAHQHVLDHYHPRVRAKELLTILQAITALNSNTKTDLTFKDGPVQENFQPIRFPIEIERHPTLFEMAFYTLRYRGVRTLAKQIWIYLRRLLVPVWPYRKQDNPL